MSQFAGSPAFRNHQRSYGTSAYGFMDGGGGASGCPVPLVIAGGFAGLLPKDSEQLSG